MDTFIANLNTNTFMNFFLFYSTASGCYIGTAVTLILYAFKYTLMDEYKDRINGIIYCSLLVAFCALGLIVFLKTAPEILRIMFV